MDNANFEALEPELLSVRKWHAFWTALSKTVRDGLNGRADPMFDRGRMHE